MGRLGAHGRGQINYGKYCGVCVMGMIKGGQKPTLVKKSLGLLGLVVQSRVKINQG